MFPRHFMLHLACAAGIAAFGAKYTYAAAAAAPPRYTLDGHGAMRLDAPAQRGGGLSLKAALLPAAVQTRAPGLLAGSRFALSATLGPEKPGICFSDTIFRDDFDADGF